MMWLIILLGIVVGLLVALAVVAAVVATIGRSKRGAWKPPERSGPPTRIRALAPEDPPLSPNAIWRGEELEVREDQAGAVRLFEVEVAGADQCVLLYRFRVRAESLKSPAYAEMWCRVTGKGEFFSRGLDQKVSEGPDWRTVEVPFYLEQGQKADLVKLNLVFEGPGVVRMSEIEVLSAPVKPRLQAA